MPSRSDQSELLKTPEAAEKETTPLGSTDPGVVAGALMWHSRPGCAA